MKSWNVLWKPEETDNKTDIISTNKSVLYYFMRGIIWIITTYTSIVIIINFAYECVSRKTPRAWWYCTKRDGGKIKFVKGFPLRSFIISVYNLKWRQMWQRGLRFSVQYYWVRKIFEGKTLKILLFVLGYHHHYYYYWHDMCCWLRFLNFNQTQNPLPKRRLKL